MAPSHDMVTPDPASRAGAVSGGPPSGGHAEGVGEAGQGGEPPPGGRVVRASVQPAACGDGHRHGGGGGRRGRVVVVVVAPGRCGGGGRGAAGPAAGWPTTRRSSRRPPRPVPPGRECQQPPRIHLSPHSGSPWLSDRIGHQGYRLVLRRTEAGGWRQPGVAGRSTSSDRLARGLAGRVEGPEHHAGGRLGVEVGGLRRHAPAGAGPLGDLLDRRRPATAGRPGTCRRRRREPLPATS